jgi:hypothetical protein
MEREYFMAAGIILFLAIGWLDRKNQKVTLDEDKPEDWAARQ